MSAMFTRSDSSVPEQLRIVWRVAESRRAVTRTRTTRALPTVGLFAGIGGLERGLGQAQHEALALCEIDPGAVAVLEHQFPGVKLHFDVRKLKRLPAKTELLVGGFPCQDLSQAGKTRGISGKNSGLVGEVFRLLDSKRIPLVALENVPFMLQLARGRALNVMVTEFERLGYKWAYRVVDTRSFGLPQRRQRVLFVAALDEDPRGILFGEDSGEPLTPDAKGLACGFYWTEGIRGLGWAVDAIPTLKGGSTVGVPSPPAIVMPDGSVVTPDIRDAERLQGFPKNWTRPAEQVTKRGHRWKLVGNAVSVPVAKWLGQQIARPWVIEGSLPGTRPLRASEAWPRAAWNIGDGRFTADISTFPRQLKRKHLHEFLTEPPKPLSERATAGFLERTQRSSLRFPAGFIDAVEAHLERVRQS